MSVCIEQVSADTWSLTAFPDDLVNWLSTAGSGEAANLKGEVRADLAIEFFAARDIPAGSALTVDMSGFQ